MGLKRDLSNANLTPDKRDQVINGKLYIVYSCECRINKANGPFWYIGVTGSHNSLRPSIFAPAHSLGVFISMKEVVHLETVGAN